MTRLPNRLALEEQLPPLLKKAAADGESVAVFFIDVDRFKTVNDTLGHRGGDILLRAVAHRLQSCLKTDATIYRSGGDEFIVVMPGVTEPNVVSELSARILAAFARPFRIDERHLSVSSSVGVGLFPQNARRAADLIASADFAMYRAKESGRCNVKFFEGVMRAPACSNFPNDPANRTSGSTRAHAVGYAPDAYSSSDEVRQNARAADR